MEQTIAQWMTRHISSVLARPEDSLNPADTFDTIGLDSVEAVIMAGMMEEEFGVTVDPMELYENPSVAQFASHLAARLAAASETAVPK